MVGGSEANYMIEMLLLKTQVAVLLILELFLALTTLATRALITL
jgi:hypothetical protein